MKKSVSYEDVFEYAGVANRWLAKDEGHVKTKLGYAIQRVGSRVDRLMKKYQRAVRDIHTDNCATDDKGVILEQNGVYQFKPEGAKKVSAAIAELDAKEVEIEPYFAAEIPADLTDFERDMLTEFVIDPERVTMPVAELQTGAASESVS